MAEVQVVDNVEVDGVVNVHFKARFDIERCGGNARRGIFYHTPFVAVYGLKSEALPGG